MVVWTAGGVRFRPDVFRYFNNGRRRMGRLTRDEKEIIAYNIAEMRKRKYPGHGGGKKCAAEFGVPAQQWSPWESGGRTPDDNRMAEIARFFNVPVVDLRKEPENWEKVKPAWMATKRRSKHNPKPPPEPPSQPAAPPAVMQPATALPTKAKGDDSDIMAIMSLLVAGHGKIETGEMTADDYSGKMRQLLDFATFLLEK
jgi:transcriptional regulator with XRE-family HTH domain